MATPEPSSRRSPQPGGLVLPELAPFQALWRATVTALVLVLPAAILNNYLIDSGEMQPGDPATFLFFLVILLGGAAGGWAVLRLSPRAGLSYAAAAGAGAYLLTQALGVVLRLITDEPISWLAFPFLAVLMATCGTFGGLFARRWQAQNGPTEDADEQ